jgi:hypothetical protein
MTGYQIGDIIGRGGMGVVHSGRHVGLDRPVAVKFLSESLSGDPEFSSRFLREARICARLDHPGIVRVYDTGSDGGRPYIVMELLEGETLRQRIKRGAMPEGEAVRVAREVLAALEAAHLDHVVHRDVKPGNVFLCRSGVVKVMDFGIARALTEMRLTGTGTQLGTPEYMSPEQVKGQPADARSDVYAVGILLYEMLTADVPFRADTPAAVLYQQVTKPPPPLAATISRRVRDTVRKALAKEPRDRYPSASAMLQSLAAVPSDLHPEQAGARSGAAVGAQEESGSGPRSLRHLRPAFPASKAGWWAAIVLLIATLGAGALRLVPGLLAGQKTPNRVQPPLPPPDDDKRRAEEAARKTKEEAQRVAGAARQLADEVDAEIERWSTQELTAQQADKVKAELKTKARQAQQQSERAVQLDPDNELGWVTQVRALIQLGDTTKARKVLDQAMARLPGSEELKKQRKEMGH